MKAFAVEHGTLRKRSNHSEDQLQKTLVEYLRLTLRRGWVFFHVPNNPRNPIAGRRLKEMGLRAGCCDLVFVAPPNGRCYGLELKAGTKGRQSKEQKAFALDLDAAGGSYALARSMDEAIAQLRSWGALRISEERAA